ncbi:hypothetical protein [Amycolatopsis sp. NPDC054798]
MLQFMAGELAILPLSTAMTRNADVAFSAEGASPPMTDEDNP